jgi:TM2 domain-containing membrane protein YozV
MEVVMDNKIVFGIMCIIFNSLGVPCFLQGKTATGVLRIVLALITFGIVGAINEIMGVVLGVKVLTMSDEEYEAKKGNISMGVPGGIHI